MIIDYLESLKNKNQYKKNINLSIKTSIITQLLSDNFDKSANCTKHPLHDIRLYQYLNMMKNWIPEKAVNINFGDSLTDMSKKQIERYHNLVLSISGSWAHHIQQMIEDTSDCLKKFKVQNISIGCLGGNPLLVYQNFDEVVRDTISCLNKLRQLYPNSRIIVYGLPPVYNIHVNQNTYQFDSILNDWVEKDINSRFVNLKARFGTGWGKLFPSCEWSSDGVHFNTEGACIFSELIYNKMM